MPAADRDELIHALESALALEPSIAWAYVFGSLARGETYRDVDVAFMPAAKQFESLVEIGALQTRLAEAVGAELDLVDLRTATLPLIGSILADRKVLLDRLPADRREWEADHAVRWLDFRPVYEHAAELRREAMRARLEREARRS